jgi:tetratricopeptide (TPR) repeat protein
LEIVTQMAQLHLDFNQVEKADAMVCQALDKDKGHLAANFIKGRIHLIRGEYPEALERFNFLAKERPRSDSVYYYRALALIHSGEAKLAEQDLLRAVELNPRSINPRLLLAENYLRGRERMLARQQVETILKLAPLDKRAITLAGTLKMLEQDSRGAEEMFNKLVQLYPQEGSSHMRLGAFYSAAGKPERAESQLKKALELEPENRGALAVITEMYLKQKRYDDALNICEIQESWVRNNPQVLAFVKYLEGRICLAKDDRAKALQHFEEAIETDPNLLAAYEGMARIHLLDKRLAEARDRYQEIVSKNPGYVAGYMALGTINDRMGEHEKAAVNYRKALKIDKNFAPAANNLAWNLIGGGGNIDEALGFAQTAKQRMPKSAAVMDTLGWIYSMKGSYLNAIAELHDAVHLDGSNPVINYHLGMVWYKHGQPEKAREFLEKALVVDQEFSEADHARRVLKEIKAKS